MLTQLNLFDIGERGASPYPEDLENLPENEMVNIMRKATGLDFQYDSTLNGNKWYVAKRNGAKYTLHYGRFVVDDFAKFISCGYQYKLGGSNSPCRTIEEAIKFFQKERN